MQRWGGSERGEEERQQKQPRSAVVTCRNRDHLLPPSSTLFPPPSQCVVSRTISIMSSITSHKATNGKDGQWHQQRVSYIFNAFDPSGAGDKETKTSNLKMSNVFGDPKLLAQVRAWLIGNQKGEERLLFMLEAMKKLRYEASAGLLEDHGMAALELYQTYLMNGAEREINLEPALRFDVLDRIDQCLSIDEVSLLSCYTLITTPSCFIHMLFIL